MHFISARSCISSPTQTPQSRWPAVVLVALLVTLFTGVATAQAPVAELPRVYIDTTYNLPTGGTTWAVHTPAQLTAALNGSAPGDVIVLDAGTTLYRLLDATQGESIE